jgi:hypothetical protein
MDPKNAFRSSLEKVAIAFAQVRGCRSSPLYVAGQVAGSHSNGGVPRVELRGVSRAADAMLAAMKISYTPIRVNRVKRDYLRARGLPFDA